MFLTRGEMAVFPCSHCETNFQSEYELYDHALSLHNPQTLVRLIRRELGGQVKKLTKADFIQTDSQWFYAIGGFHLSLVRNSDGDFSLQVYGSVEPIPKATQYPTEPEWDKALELANKFLAAYVLAVEREQG